MILNGILKKIKEAKEIRRQKKLARDLKARTTAIKTENRRRVITDIIFPCIQIQAYKDTNMLMPDGQALEIAIEVFNEAKKQGRIDEFNNIVKDV